jgi:hypothetical protein
MQLSNIRQAIEAIIKLRPNETLSWYEKSLFSICDKISESISPEAREDIVKKLFGSDMSKKFNECLPKFNKAIDDIISQKVETSGEEKEYPEIFGRDIIKESLQNNNFDGLMCDGCSCHIDNLAEELHCDNPLECFAAITQDCSKSEIDKDYCYQYCSETDNNCEDCDKKLFFPAVTE